MTSNGSGYYYYDANTRIWSVGAGPINKDDDYLQFSDNLDMSNNNITDVSSLSFHNTTYITSGYISGSSRSDIKSLIYNNNGYENVSNPVSIMRISHFTNDVSYNINSSDTPILFGTQQLNQLGITFVDISKTRFIFPNELSGQFIELYVIQKTYISSNNMSITVDISSINNTYNESIDTRFYDRTTTISSTFGPHLISPTEYHSNKIYSLFTYYTVGGGGGGSAKLIRSEIIMKSYYV
jgi:hypothetical protein